MKKSKDSNIERSIALERTFYEKCQQYAKSQGLSFSALVRTLLVKAIQTSS